jgi:hypothetical protein
MSQYQAMAKHAGVWNGAFYYYKPTGENWAAGVPDGVKDTIIQFDDSVAGEIRQLNKYEGGSELALVYKDNGTDGFDFTVMRGDTIIPGGNEFVVGLWMAPNGSPSGGIERLAGARVLASEQGFVEGDRKLRSMAMFDQSGALARVTVMRENRNAPWDEEDGEPITREALDGPWTLEEELHAGRGAAAANYEGTQFIRMPGNHYMRAPLQLPLDREDKSFSIEIGWIPSAGRLLTMTRAYGPDGVWSGSTYRVFRKG